MDFPRIRIVVLCLFAACASADAEGEVNTPSPPGLSEQFKELETLHGRRGTPPAVFFEMLAGFRAQLRDYFQDNPLENPDYREWSYPLMRCYEWTIQYAPDYEQAEQSLKEGIRLARSSHRDNAAAASRIALQLAVVHAHAWLDEEPERCAALLDAVKAKLMSDGSPRIRNMCYMTAAPVETMLLRAAGRMNSAEGRILYDQRMARLQETVNAANLSLSVRSRCLSWMAGAEMAAGRYDKALGLLKNWWRTNEGEIESPYFYHAMMRAFLFGRGDWSSAGKVLETATEAAAGADAPSRQRIFAAITRMYYRNMYDIGYELKRRAK